jgi:hypothetical protein
LAVPHLNGLRFLAYDDILYLKGERAYTSIVCKDGTTLTASRNLKHFEDLLSGKQGFLPLPSLLHRQPHLCEGICPLRWWALVMEGKVHVSISPERVDALLARVGLA